MEPVKEGARIGQALRRAREMRGFTQAQVAPALGVSRSTVAQMEAGRRTVKAQDVGRLATYYGISANHLLASASPKSPQQASDDLDEMFDAYPSLNVESGQSVRRVVNVARWLGDIERKLGFELVCNAQPSYTASPVENAWQGVRQGYRASEDERRRLALGEGPVRLVDELLMTVSVRSARSALPDGIASISINQPDTGFLVIVSDEMDMGSRRFYYAHGLAHALFDRDLPWRVCRMESDDLCDVRASAFASGFLLPEHGIRRYLETVGKDALGRSGPTVQSVFAEGHGEGGEARRVDGRARGGRDPLSLSDLTRVAHYYGVSCTLTAHRLRNLRFLTDADLLALGNLELGQIGERAARTLALPVESYQSAPLHSRLASLAGLAFRRNLIDEDSFHQYATAAGVPEDEHAQLIALSGGASRTEPRKDARHDETATL